METAQFRRQALLPKRPTRGRARMIRHAVDNPFGSMIEDLTPDERRALRAIVAGADLIEAAGRRYLLAPVDDRTLDVLSAFEADMEDREPEEDDDSDDDNAFERDGGTLEAFDERECEDDPRRSRPPAGSGKSREAFIAARRDVMADLSAATPSLDLAALSRRLAFAAAPVGGGINGLSLAVWCRELAEIVDAEGRPDLAGYALLWHAHAPLAGLVNLGAGGARDGGSPPTLAAASILHAAVGLPWPPPAPAVTAIRAAERRLDSSILVEFGLRRRMPAGVARLPWRIGPSLQFDGGAAWLARLRVLADDGNWRGPAIAALQTRPALRSIVGGR